MFKTVPQVICSSRSLLGATACLATTALAPAAADPSIPPKCSPAVIRDLAKPSDEPYILRCSIFGRSERTQELVIARPLIIEDRGVAIHCDGGLISPPGNDPQAILIRSQRQDAVWHPPRDLIIHQCSIRGSVRIKGRGRNGEAEPVRRSSRSLGHTERLQRSAPSHILLSNLELEGTGTIPLYIAPGTTRVTLFRSILTGFSRSTAIYLDAESRHNVIAHNRIETQTERELIAIDGSADNVIAQNQLSGDRGGIFLYRNCGEGGTIRHQPPQGNLLLRNAFTHKENLRAIDTRGLSRITDPPPGVWIGSRMGYRLYCGDDAGEAFGSSIDDRDFARYNQIIENTLTGYQAGEAIRKSDSPNHLRDNAEQPR